MPISGRTNEEIKRDIIEHLFWGGRIDSSDVHVEVSEREINLSGTVEDYTAFNATEENAWNIKGVRKVRNDLTIQYPEDLILPTDSEIKANIENLLRWQSNIEAENITIKVNNRNVTITGTINALWKKNRLEEMIQGMSGVQEIHNELSVVPKQKFDDRTISDNIMNALRRHANIDEDLIDITVNNSNVTLSGTVSSLSSYKDVQKIAENTSGVIIVDNELMVR